MGHFENKSIVGNKSEVFAFKNQCILIIEQSENNACMLQDNTSRQLAAKYELEFCRK